MVTGRPDFWYGQILLFQEEPEDGVTTAGPTSNWAYDHENNPDAHHSSFDSGDAAALIAIHAADDDAHHEVYEAADGLAAIENHRTTEVHTQEQPSDHATPIAAHAADDNAHHEVYEQADADNDFAAHVGAADPHTQYQKESEKDANSGYAKLDASGYLYAKGARLYMARDGSNQIVFGERTAAETVFYFIRGGANDYAGYIKVGGAAKAILTTVHTDAADPHTQYQKESEKGAASGYPALNASSNLIIPGNRLYLTRNVSDNIILYEYTSDESAFYMHRTGEDDYEGYIKDGGAWKEILTETHIAAADPHTQYQKESEKDVNSGYAALDSSGLLLAKGFGVKIPRNASDNVLIFERTSGEYPFYLHRNGANDYDAYIMDGGAAVKLLTPGSLIFDNDDPAAAHWAIGDLTRDDAPHDLDCSGTVGAKAVEIKFYLFGTAAAVGDYLYIRTNGKSNWINAGKLGAVVNGAWHYAEVNVMCDSNGVVEYMIGTGDWSALTITIGGWRVP